MKEYPHIDTIWKRDPNTGVILPGEYSNPEFEYLADNKWVGTEKIDGTDIRVMFKDGRRSFGGKTDKAQIPAFLLAKLQQMFPTENLAAAFSGDVCLYGEGYGARIQKGGGNYIPDGVSFVLFDVLIDGWWLKRDALEEIAANLNIDIVPVVFSGNLFAAIHVVQQGFKSVYGTAQAEGLVLQPEVQLFDRRGHRIITKIKAKDFKHVSS